MTPDDIRALREQIDELRTIEGPFDVVTGGVVLIGTQNQHIAGVAAAGATWWVEYVPVADGDYASIRRQIERGPLTIN